MIASRTDTEPEITSYNEGELEVAHLRRLSPPKAVWIMTGILSIIGTFSPNPVLTPVCVVILVGCSQLLWRRGEPPVLVFGCAMQWLQAAGVVFYTDYLGMSVSQAAGSAEFELATWLSVIAIPVVAIGMRLGLSNCGAARFHPLREEALRIDVPKAFIAYLITFVIASIAAVIAFSVPSLTQIIYALIPLKWVMVFIVGYSVLEQRAGYGFLVCAITLEFFFGLLGAFSGFKNVFFIVLLAALTSPLALRGRRLLIVSGIGLVLLITGIAWTSIKMEYRAFLTEAGGQEGKAASFEDSFDELGQLVSTVNWDSVGSGLESLVLRINYVQYFALTIMNVPNNLPYENGALWMGSIKHVFTPRLLFPDKGELDDSARTAYYTGTEVSGMDAGTSIGIGYVGESYIDFGPVYMFVPIFLLGIFYGIIYRIFSFRSRYLLLGTAIATAILTFGAYSIETSNIKLVGGNVTAVIVMGALYLAFGGALNKWLDTRT